MKACALQHLSMARRNARSIIHRVAPKQMHSSSTMSVKIVIALVVICISCRTTVAESIFDRLFRTPGSTHQVPSAPIVLSHNAPSPQRDTTHPVSIARQSQSGASIQMNPSVMVVGAYDWQPETDGTSRCTQMVDKAAMMGGDRINWFTTHYWWVSALVQSLKLFRSKASALRIVKSS